MKQMEVKWEIRLEKTPKQTEKSSEHPVCYIEPEGVEEKTQFYNR